VLVLFSSSGAMGGRREAVAAANAARMAIMAQGGYEPLGDGAAAGAGKSASVPAKAWSGGDPKGVVEAKQQVQKLVQKQDNAKSKDPSSRNVQLQLGVDSERSGPWSRQWVRPGALRAGLPGAPPSGRMNKKEVQEFNRQMKQVLLALGMLASGTANTVTCKLAMSRMSVGRHGGEPRSFNHPFVMAGFMFLGEIFCLGAYYLSRLRRRSKSKKRYNASACALPACCDIMATSIMYVGLSLTTASTYQMLRGSVVLFTASFSVLFLKRKQWGFHWIGLFTVFGGTMVVGVSSLVNAPSGGGGDNGIGQLITGDVLVVAAQIFTAVQMVVEERFVSGHDMPALLAVGCEGSYGMLALILLLVVLQFAPNQNGLPIEDSLDAFAQIRNDSKLLMLLLLNSLSIALFNAFGITITKVSSAAYRMVLDSMRTLTVWVIGLAFAGEYFHWLQVCGFVLLAVGTMLYNEGVRLPCSGLYPTDAQREEEKAAQEARRVRPALEENLMSSPRASELRVGDHFTPSLSRWTLHMGGN